MTYSRGLLVVALASALVPTGLGTSVSAQQTPSPAQACTALGSFLTVQQPPAPTSGSLVAVPVRVRGPADTYTVTLTRQDPAPVAVVRSTTADTTTPITFSVRLGETHRFTVTATNERCGRPESTSVDVQAPVRATVTINAARLSPRAYRFSGRVQPASGTVALYRVEASGRHVLTSRSSVNADGTYRMHRRFTASGRFGFVTVAEPASTGQHIGGSSPARPTVIH